MIDPMLPLAFALYSSPGVYALLLGSGISRAAQIPTGWEIIMDLTRQVARLEGAGELADSERWYRERFNEPPNYSRLLALVAPSQVERQRLLRDYFEPTDEERANGAKLPTAAHRAIAALVARGTIRVILTTNFDRLLEQALEAAGVVPVVISTSAAASGALPLQHERCVVIKLHGDYLDHRIRNTDEELATYDADLNRLLDRGLDDYGLITCGWSGDWDTALRDAIARCQTRRFTTYWMARGAPSDQARQLIQLRHGQLITITSADDAFQQLAEKVQALEEHHKPHPLSAALAVTSLKQYLPEERYRIRLHDLVMGEVERCYAAITDEQRFSLWRDGFPDDAALDLELLRQVRSYEALSEILVALFVHGCYWSEPQHDPLWAKALERLAQRQTVNGAPTTPLALRRYPALLMLYAGGMAALAGGRHHTFATLLTRPQVRDPYNADEKPLACSLYPNAVFENNLGKRLPALKDRLIPVSDWLYEVLRAPLRVIISDDLSYQRLFDRFEYLLALVHADVESRIEKRDRYWGPFGSFSWRYRHYIERGIAGVVQKEIDAQQGAWPLLQVGLFEGSLDRLHVVKTGFDEILKRGTGGWM